MSSNSALSQFVKIYNDRPYKHVALLRHRGNVIAFAMDDQRQIHYAILNLNNVSDDLGELDVSYWPPNPNPLMFPSEITQVGFGGIELTTMPLVKRGTRIEANPNTLRPDEIDLFLSTTARLTADAPFTVYSDEQHVFVFRQSLPTDSPDMVFRLQRGVTGAPDAAPDNPFVTDIDGNKVPVVDETLLCDRFVMTGGLLKPKMEIRYRRSRKLQPASSKDSLGAMDMEDNPFFEPTQELDFVRNLQAGRFSVLQLPTEVAGVKRWQLFAHNSATGRIDSFNIAVAENGLFDTLGTQFYTSPDPEFRDAVFEPQPGTCPFTERPLIPVFSESGHAETCLAFDGVSNFIHCPEAPLLDGAFTQECWVYPQPATDGDYGILGSAEPASAFAPSILITDTDKLTVGFGDGTTWLSYTTQSVLRAEEWNHVAVTYEEGRVTIFVDGELKEAAELAADATPAPYGVCYLGRAGDAFLKGKLDEVRLWGYSRSPSSIKDHMHRRLVGNNPGLIAYWRMDEGSGELVQDQSDNQHDGRLLGARRWELSDAPIGDQTSMRRSSFLLQEPGVPSQEGSLKLDPAANSYASIPYAESLNTSIFTVTAWVKCTGGDGTYRAVITSRDTSPSRGFIIYATPNNKWEFWAGKPGAYWTKLAGPTVENGSWVHLAGQFDGAKVRFYVNGVTVGVQTTGYNRNTGQPLYIGAGNTEQPTPSYYFPGSVAEVRIWNLKLTGEQIAKQAHQSLYGHEPGLAAYWRLNDGVESTAHDATGNGHDATVHGPVDWQASGPLLAPDVRTPASGIASLLYFQQEEATTGYDDSSVQPIKTRARVMVAVATAGGEAGENPRVAALDFAVSREGRLGQVPDRIPLPKVDGSNNAAFTRLYELQQQLIKLLALDDRALESTTYDAPDAAQNPKTFGRTVCIADDVMAIGAPGDHNGAGRVYVYGKEASGWSAQPVQVLSPSTNVANAKFGTSIAISGNTLVVGAPSFGEKGRVYVFDRADESSDFTESARLEADVISSDLYNIFGASVDIAGDVLIIGNPTEPELPYRRPSLIIGYVYIYERDAAGAWSLKRTLSPPAGRATCINPGRFGTNVAVTADRAIVTSKVDTSATSQQRLYRDAYLFERNSDGTWPHTSQRRLLAEAGVSDPNEQETFPISMDENSVVIGVADKVTLITLRDDGVYDAETLYTASGMVEGVQVRAGRVASVCRSADYAKLSVFEANAERENDVGPSAQLNDAPLSVGMDSEFVVVGMPESKSVNGTTSGTFHVFSKVIAQNKADLEQQITELEQQLGEDTSTALPLLHSDPDGLVFSGGDLHFAATTAAPMLFDSGAGSVGLYYSGADKTFYTAYFQTKVARARYALGAEAQELSFVATVPHKIMNGTKVTVTDDADRNDLCTVTIENRSLRFTERWPSVPREGSAMARVLNGLARPETIGTVMNLLPYLSFTGAEGALCAAPFRFTAGIVPSHYSVEAWFRPADSAVDRTLFAATLGGTPGVILRRTTSGQIAYRHRDPASGQETEIVSDDACEEGRWHHLCAVYNGADQVLYLNGAEATRGAAAPAFDEQLDVAIGKGDGADGFVGGIAEVKVWDRARTQAEIEADRFRKGHEREFGLVAYWKMHEGEGLELVDRTLNEHDASVASASSVEWLHTQAVDRLRLRRPSLVNLPAGASVRLGKTVYTVVASTPPGSAELPIAASDLHAGSDDTLFYLPYDYRLPTLDTLLPMTLSLRNGSLLVNVREQVFEHGVENGQSRLVASGVGGYWEAKSPGDCYSFNGNSSYLSLPADKIPQLDFDGALTLEAWVKPNVLESRARLLHHNSASTAYTLALEPVSLGDTAVMLGGTDAYLDCEGGDDERPWQKATFECWFKTSTSQERVLLCSDSVVVAILSDGKPRVTERDESGASVASATSSAAYNDGEWHHIAAVVEEENLRLLVDGVETQSAPRSTAGAPIRVSRKLGIGSDDGAKCFLGSVDDIRVWELARSDIEIFQDHERRLSGSESGLWAYFYFTGESMYDRSGNGNTAVPHGYLSFEAGPARPLMTDGAQVVVGTQSWADNVGYFTAVQQPLVLLDRWTHLACSFWQSYGLRFSGNGYVDCGNGEALNIAKDLTIEIALRLDRLGAIIGLISKGRMPSGSGQNVPYQIYIDQGGHVVFAFQDESGVHHMYSSRFSVTAGQFHHIAVVRRGVVNHEQIMGTETVEIEVDGETKDMTINLLKDMRVEETQELRFFLDGVVDKKTLPDGTTAEYYTEFGGSQSGVNSEPLELGRCVSNNGGSYSMTGIISEIRLWNEARSANLIGRPIKGEEQGLVAWWRLQDREGNVASDSRGSHDGKIVKARWAKDPNPHGSRFTIYVNGTEAAQTSHEGLEWDEHQFTMAGRKQGAIASELLGGLLEEVRVWRTNRSHEQILDNLFTRLKGDTQDLLAYYVFDEASTKQDATELLDHSLRGNDLPLPAPGSPQRPAIVLSDAPISDDAAMVRSALAGIGTQFHQYTDGRVGVAEYGDMQRTAEGEDIGVLKRAYAYTQNGEWNLFTGYKVGNLITEWISQAQFDPQVIGYVEGYPPVPSENMTEGQIALDTPWFDIENFANLEVVESKSVSYAIGTSKEQSLDAAFEAALSKDFAQKVLLIKAPLGIGVATEEVSVNVQAGLQGKFEASAGWSKGHSYGTSINRSRSLTVAMGATWEGPETYQQANPDLGRRLVAGNVGFAIVQSETADLFALRLEHNKALVSFHLRPNPDIPKDWNQIVFPINPRYTKQGTLDGAIGFDNRGSKVTDPDYPDAIGYGEFSYFKPREAYAWKKRIERQEQQLINYYESQDTDYSNVVPKVVGNIAKMAASILAGPIVGSLVGGDAIRSLARSIDTYTGNRALPSQFAKRDLVNTYVWTADGGFLAETTETADTRSESVSGSLSYGGGAGLDLAVEVEIFGAGFNLAFQATMGASMNLTRTRDKESEQAFAVNVNVDIPGDLRHFVRGADGELTADGSSWPGKVDAYRFMSFYLNADERNFQELFNKVVDPIWLAESDSPNAVALRQANQASKRPACWRVFHRVTFVSRVLPDFQDPTTAPPLDVKMKALNINSNWELISRLHPFVRDKTDDRVAFARAVRAALKKYLPELYGFSEDIVSYMCDYYGIVY
ncbi:MAG: hypothetical protein Tsb0020_20460 [Haliangiales bacterium]